MAETVINTCLIKESDIVYFFDNDISKWGKKYLKKKVKKPIYDENIIIIVTSMYYVEIVFQLIQLGYRNFFVTLEHEGKFLIKKYDYSSFDNFDVIPNKVALISENSSGCNAYGLQYMYKKYLNDGSLIFSNINIKYDENYFYDIFTSKIIVYTHVGREIQLPGKYNIQLWHGFPLKGLNYTSNYAIMERKIVEEQHKRFLMMDVVGSLGSMYNLLLGASYGIPRNLFKVTGYPRNDILLLSDGRKNLSDLLPGSEDKKIIFYMPTFKKTVYGEKEGNEKGYIFNFSDFIVEKFNEYCRKNNILFLIKIHAYDYKCIEDELIESDNIKILRDEYFHKRDLYEYLNAADILITDYSSAYFDYLLLDRPIIFVDTDTDIYAEERGFLLQPLEQWRPGIVIKNTEELMSQIVYILEGKDDFNEKRKWVRNQVHEYQDTSSSARIINIIKNILSI